MPAKLQLPVLQCLLRSPPAHPASCPPHPPTLSPPRCCPAPPLPPTPPAASRAIARLIEGKSADEIRETFRLPDDLSEEEKLEPIQSLGGG